MFVAAILVIITIFIINLLSESNNKRRLLPPSPSHFPIIGNLHHVIGKKLPTHVLFTMLSKKLGPVFTFWFGDRPVVFVNDLHLAKKLLFSCECSGRPQRDAGKILSKNFQGLIVTDRSQVVEKRRSIIYQALRHHEHIELLKNLQVEADELVKTINDKLETANVIDITDDLALGTNNIFIKLLFNKRLTSTSGTFEHVQKLLFLLMKGLTLSNLLEGFPALRNIPLGQFMFLNMFVKGMFEFIGKEYDDHVKTFNKNEKRDLTDLLINEQNDLTRENIEVLLSDILVSSIDTTTNALKLVIYNLMKEKEDALKCRYEVDEILNENSILSIDSIHKCNYLRAFVSESLRKDCIAPLGVPHRTTSDVKVEGYTIPKNTTIFFNIHSIHTNDEIFEKPQLFKPERFLDEEGKFQNVDGFMAFSIGRRNCIGQNYATKSLVFFVAHLLRNFEIEQPDGNGMPDCLQYTTTLKMEPFKIKLSPR